MSIDRKWERDKALYDYYLSEAQAAARYQVELAKWLLATLILINGGAVVLLANSKDAALIGATGGWFVAGLANSVLGGFFAWINSGVRDMLYTDYADENGLESGTFEIPEGDKQRRRQIYWSYYLSVAFPFAALICFCIGSYSVLNFR